jgi:hypothetical protein
MADPRTGYSGCDRASHLTVAQDVTAADDHGALLAGESFSVGAMKPTAAVSYRSILAQDRIVCVYFDTHRV